MDKSLLIIKFENTYFSEFDDTALEDKLIKFNDIFPDKYDFDFYTNIKGDDSNYFFDDKRFVDVNGFELFHISINFYESGDIDLNNGHYLYTIQKQHLGSLEMILKFVKQRPFFINGKFVMFHIFEFQEVCGLTKKKLFGFKRDEVYEMFKNHILTC